MLRPLRRRSGEVGHEHKADVATLRIQRDDLLGHARRKHLARHRHGDVARHGADILAHQARDIELAHPAHVMRATDRLAAQVKAPGREGIAKTLAHNQGRQRRPRQRRRRNREIARRLERQNGHAHRRPEHAGAEGRHAGDGREPRREIERRVERNSLGIKPAKQASKQERGEKQTAAKAGAQRDRRSETLENDHASQHAERHGLQKILLKGAMARAQHLRGDEAESADDQSTQRWSQHDGQLFVAEHPFGQRDALHQQNAAESAEDAENENVPEELARRCIEIADDGQRTMAVRDHARDEARDDRTGDHRNEGRHRIGAEHDLKGVKSSRERRSESRGDCARRAAGDQQPHVGAARRQSAPHEGRKRGADLRIGGL